MLYAGAAVGVEVLLDLAALEPLGGLVERHGDPGVIGHHGRAQGAVLGGDLVLVEVAELAEPHHVLVERDPLVELADLDVADDVVDAVERHRREAGGRGWQAGGDVAGAVVTGVVAAVDEGVLGLAVGADGRQAQRAVLVAEVVRLAHRSGAPGDRRFVGDDGVVDDERQVLGAIAVFAHVGPDRRVGSEAGGDDEADVALLQEVRGDVVTSGLGARVGGDLEAERGGEEPGHRPGVADVELERVPSLQTGGGCGHVERRHQRIVDRESDKAINSSPSACTDCLVSTPTDSSECAR